MTTTTTSSPMKQQQQQQQSRPRRQPHQHPWILPMRMLLPGALKPPSTRDFLDPCSVSLRHVFDINAVRGGADNNNNNNNNHYNNNYNNNNNNDDWSRRRHHPQQHHSDLSTNMNHDSDSYGDDDDPQNDQKRNRNSFSRRTNNNPTSHPLRSTGSNGRPNLLLLMQTVDRKTGLMLLVSGLSVTFLGVTLFFNKTIIRLGHLLCMAGILLSMGLSSTIQYFVRPEKLRATICLGLGAFLVLIGSPIFGMALEIFGILNLFGNMFPIVMMMMKQMPIVGTMFQSNNKNRNSNNNNSKNNNNEYYDNRHDSYRRPASPHSYDNDDAMRGNDDEYAREEDDGLGRRY